MKSFAIVDSLKDNGCATRVLNELKSIPHISDIKVNLEERLVSFQCNDDYCRFIATQALRVLNCGEGLVAR